VVRELSIALPAPARLEKNRSLPFARLCCRSVVQYATPASTLRRLVEHEFHEPARGLEMAHRSSKEEGLPERSRYSPSSIRAALLDGAR
jgi:hypothetical protein